MFMMTITNSKTLRQRKNRHRLQSKSGRGKRTAGIIPKIPNQNPEARKKKIFLVEYKFIKLKSHPEILF